MKNNLVAWLLSTGLDEQRAKLYLAGLSRGESTAKELSEDLGIGRTAVYDNLKYLESRGYIKTLYRGKRKIFVALPPKDLYIKVKNQKSQLKELLPEFLSLYGGKESRPLTKIFEGPFAGREIYEDILNTAPEEYVYFYSEPITLQTVDSQYLENYIKRRIKKGIRTRSLRIKSKESSLNQLYKDGEKNLRQIRYLPLGIDLKSTIIIYGNKIGVVSTKKEGSAIIIYSPDLSFSFKEIFEFLWSVSLKS